MGEKCDRCGKEITEEYYDGGGNCTCCGDNLCKECAGKWGEYGECEMCRTETNKSLEELEFSLPLEITRKEQKRMPCPGCRKERVISARYEQRLLRLDSFFNNRHTRQYEISYGREDDGSFLFKTDRRDSLREALIEAHRELRRLGIDDVL
jgi:hypothetical protein